MDSVQFANARIETSCCIHRRHDREGFGAIFESGDTPNFKFWLNGMMDKVRAHSAELSTIVGVGQVDPICGTDQVRKSRVAACSTDCFWKRCPKSAGLGRPGPRRKMRRAAGYSATTSGTPEFASSIDEMICATRRLSLGCV